MGGRDHGKATRRWSALRRALTPWNDYFEESAESSGRRSLLYGALGGTKHLHHEDVAPHILAQASILLKAHTDTAQ